MCARFLANKEFEETWRAQGLTSCLYCEWHEGSKPDCHKQYNIPRTAPFVHTSWWMCMQHLMWGPLRGELPSAVSAKVTGKGCSPFWGPWSPPSHQNGECQGAGCSPFYHHFCQKFTCIKFYKQRVCNLKILYLGVCDSHFPQWLPGSRRKHWEGVMLTTWLSLLQFCSKICSYMRCYLELHLVKVWAIRPKSFVSVRNPRNKGWF